MGADAPVGETSGVLTESSMAWLERHPTSGHFHLCFRWNGKRKRRSLSTDDAKAAEAIRLRFEENVALLERGGGTSSAGGSNVVDVVIRSLRMKLGGDASRVQTVRGVGYRLR